MRIVNLRLAEALPERMYRRVESLLSPAWTCRFYMLSFNVGVARHITRYRVYGRLTALAFAMSMPMSCS